MKRILASIAAVGMLMLLAGCSLLPAEPRKWSRGSGQISIVATTNVWADLAYQIGGKAVTSHAIIYNINQDPHSYEATVRDQLMVDKANLVLVNGGGYDDFMSKLAKNKKPTSVINAVKVAGTRADGNEHVWFSIERVRKVAAAIATKLKQLNPRGAVEIANNLAKVQLKLNSLQQKIDILKPSTTGKKVIFAEPIGGYLADALGIVDATPSAFSKAVEEGRDIPPQAAMQVKSLLKSGQIDLLVYSSATVGSQAQKLLNTNQQNVPATQIGELLVQDPDTFESMGGFFDYLLSSVEDFSIMKGVGGK